MSLRYHLSAQVNSWLPALPNRADRYVAADLPSLEGKLAFTVGTTSAARDRTPPNRQPDPRAGYSPRIPSARAEHAHRELTRRPAARPARRQQGRT